jgi:quercetin dioxygenase-like cupin family protein
MERTIVNTATGETVTYLETSEETGGAHSRLELVAKPGGGVPMHQHADHDEVIEVIEGELEVTMNGTTRRFGPADRVLIPRGTTHRWCNPSRDRDLTFRGGMTPGHPAFELFLRVYFGLGRDGELGKDKLPRRFGDLALLSDLDPSIFVGVKRLLRPLMRWTAARARKRGREAELFERYAAGFGNLRQSGNGSPPRG